MDEGREFRRLRRRTNVTVFRFIYLGLGAALILAGLALTPTPLPIGAVLIVIGLAVAARGSRWVGLAVKWLRSKVPPLSRGLNVLKPKLPKPFRRFVEKSDPGR